MDLVLGNLNKYTEENPQYIIRNCISDLEINKK